MDIAAQKMAQIKYKIAVLSGKGGVGKTTTATNLAVSLQNRGNRVCILDSDFDSSSVPRMMGVKDVRLRAGCNGIIPVETEYGVTAMSVGFVIEEAEVVTWFHDMRRAATLCRDAGVPVIGVVENMSSFDCPNCGHNTAVLRSGGGENLADELKVPFLGRVPLDHTVAAGGDEGRPFIISAPDSEAAVAFRSVVDNFEASVSRLSAQAAA